MIREYGSEFQLDEEIVASCARKARFEFTSGQVRFFRAGRDALRYLAARERDNCGGVVLLPALCCDSMSEPFVREGYKVVFFGVDADLRIDDADLTRKALANQGALLLYMSYFGILPISPESVAGLKEDASLTVVRDATHDVLGRRVDADGPDDFVLASLRKWTALPDGALLYSGHRDLGDAWLEADESFAELRRDAMTEKWRYLKEVGEASKPHYMAQLAKCNGVLDEMGGPYAMSVLSRDIMERTDWEAVGNARQCNAMLLVSRLESVGLHCYCDVAIPPLYVPVILENRDSVQKALSAIDIYCPVLWPLPEGAGKGGFAAEFSEKMLAIPCDQRYGETDMEYIADAFIDAVRTAENEQPRSGEDS